MEPTVTTNPVTTLRWSVELFDEGNPIQFFLAPGRFHSAERTSDALSLTLLGDGLFGLGLGAHPPRRDDWTRCILAERGVDHVGELRASDHWDFYSVDASRTHNDGDVEVLDDDDLIAEILHVHANDSSVWPGRDDIVAWYGLRDADDDLMSLGALVRWESGYHVLASIVTLREYRGQGFGQELVQGMVARARERGITWVGLGVSHTNIAARRVYTKAGFSLRANFTTFSRPASGDDLDE
ncbi:MAG: GNAT family N-acetyltransferase [Acidimicrobiales bacterium]